MPWAGVRTEWQEMSDPAAEAEVVIPPPRFEKMRRKIFRRDLLETIIAVLIAPFFAWFGWMALIHQKWLVMGFSALLVASSVYIPWRLWRERRKLPKPDPHWSMKRYLRAERAGLLAQAQLLEGIWWWYLGPLGIGVIGLYVSARGFVWQSAAYAAAVFALYFLIGKGNSVAAEKHYRVTVLELDEQLARLENGGLENGGLENGGLENGGLGNGGLENGGLENKTAETTETDPETDPRTS